MAFKSKIVRAEGKVLKLQPVLTNNYHQRIYIAKNPKDWLRAYSLWVDAGKGWSNMVASQHNSKATAIASAKRLQNVDVLHKLGWR